MNMWKVARIALICLLGALAVAFITNLLFKFSSCSLLSANWSAGDALAYVGAVMGSISTFVLGYIAYKQNEKLQQMEENNYIANNSGMLLVNRIVIKPKPCLLISNNILTEQLLKEHGNENDGPCGYKFSITASMIGNSVPAMIHIAKCMICVGDENNPYYLFADNNSDAYSRIAILSQTIKFDMTVLLADKSTSSFHEAINVNGRMFVEFEFKIVTDKYVSTMCKCRSYCSCENNNEKRSWHSDDPMVFFYGNEILNRRSIHFAGEETINGQTQNAHP